MSSKQNLDKLRFFEEAHKKALRASTALVWIGGAALLFCALLITMDVISRKFFGFSMKGTDEISGYIFSVTTAWAFSYCVLNRNNIRIDAIYRFLNIRYKILLDIVGCLSLLIFVSFLMTGAFKALLESIAKGTISSTGLSVPIWIPQSLWVFGITILFLSLLFQLLYSLVLVVNADYKGVSRIAGIPSTTELIKSETSKNSN
jgi:TRAP-type C4-dicarboxylate transport system permease small subunit